MHKKECLDAAIEATKDRGLNYGAPEDNFLRIANLWNVYLTGRRVPHECIGAADVANMMVLMKVARLQNHAAHLDSWVDIAGYAACGAEIVSAPARLDIDTGDGA